MAYRDQSYLLNAADQIIRSNGLGGLTRASELLVLVRDMIDTIHGGSGSSFEVDDSLEATPALRLKGDEETPTDGKFYGKLEGNKGWFVPPIPVNFHVNNVTEQMQTVNVTTATVPAIDVNAGGTVILNITHTGAVSMNSAMTTAFANLQAGRVTRLTFIVRGNAQNITFPAGTQQRTSDGKGYSAKVIVTRTTTNDQIITAFFEGNGILKLNTMEG